ncbi:serine hydrolase domain-containing protein [Mycobacterium sp. ITM-2016-00317]|uniref:serine hydrolase domain-containing protein n=1 Tax=Mycobacterium sp. ITM-2016-00317 TaxID=2099694 RepID=UPI00287FBFD8|nr:serine hydrolase domain-containing protein [Mycobacterium sp. ITM-2016-00317]WNG86750.1 serine hydrolase domain-containing protein [Mycobacterium sp. ITM-2016-00317]
MLDRRVDDGRIPGYVAAVRCRGTSEVHASGHVSFDPNAAPMAPDTPFRIASLSKPLAAALTLALVDGGVLSLDDEICRWLPEFATPAVLRRPGGTLDDTVPADRPITIADLLTSTAGWGLLLEASPLQSAVDDRRLGPGPVPPPMSGDEYVRRLAELPLAFQPGTGWLYDMPIKVLSVLLDRVTDQSLGELLTEHITGPLGMADTGFWARSPARLATQYVPTPDGGLEVFDRPDGIFAQPPAFEDLSCGLVSTGPDLLRFFSALADGGDPVLRPESVRLMTADHLSDDQRRQGQDILGDGHSWGLGTAVAVESTQPWLAPGRWGWIGGTGTTAHVQPDGGVAIFLSQRMLADAQEGFDDFWAAFARA